MFAGMALSVHLLVYAGLSLFIISGPYLYVVVCVLYAYNLALMEAIYGSKKKAEYKMSLAWSLILKSLCD